MIEPSSRARNGRRDPRPVYRKYLMAPRVSATGARCRGARPRRLAGRILRVQINLDKEPEAARARRGRATGVTGGF